MLDALTLILGKVMTGKTVRMLYELESERRVVLVDGKCGTLTGLAGWRHVFPEYDPKAKVFRSIEVLDLAVMRDDLCRLAFHIRNYHRESLEIICKVVKAARGITLAVDELSLFAFSGSPSSLPPEITSVVVSGTHDGVKFVGTSQRPSMVHITARANATRMLVYRMTEDADMEAVRSKLPGEFADMVLALPDQVCVDWADGREPFLDRSFAGKLGRILPERKF